MDEKGKKQSVRPVKGFRDFFPADWKVEKYIFNVWRRVCESYGYEEYNSPTVENASIYAKSGQDVGISGKELYRFTDKGGRDLALRPEMTPSVGRMIAALGQGIPKPIRWFSIARFFRAEKPQRGRAREFFQLNADIFGSEGTLSELEIIKLSIDLMVAFGATEKMFKVKINNRKFANYYFSNKLEIENDATKAGLLRAIDASSKKDKRWLKGALEDLGLGGMENLVDKYLKMDVSGLEDYRQSSEGAKELTDLFELLDKTGLSKYCEFDTSIARGFDYYTGMVFEVFDLDLKNNRAIFGGGRYDNLLDIFDKPRIPAVGFGQGDYPMKLFLESWGLIDQMDADKRTRYFAPLIDEAVVADLISLVSLLRKNGKNVTMGLSQQSLESALREANKKGFDGMIILGSLEKGKGIYKIKNMKDGKEEICKLV